MSKSFRQPFTLFTNEIPPFLVTNENTIFLIQDFHNYFSNVHEGIIFKISDELYLNEELEEYKNLLLIAKKNTLFEKTLKPKKNDLIFSKGFWSSASNVTFVKYLKKRKISNVIISGNFLEYGILNTTFDLMNMGINTLIVSDAVTSLTYQANTFIKGSITHGLTKLRSTGETIELINDLNTNNQVIL